MGRFEITRRIPAWGWLIIGVAGLVLTGITFFIEVQIVLIKPDLGNVSGTVAAVGRALTAFATLAAFVVGIYNKATDGDDTESGPESAVTFAGENNDFTINLGFPPEQRSPQATDEEQSDSTPPDEKNRHLPEEASAQDDDPESS